MMKMFCGARGRSEVTTVQNTHGHVKNGQDVLKIESLRDSHCKRYKNKAFVDVQKFDEIRISTCLYFKKLCD